MRALQGNHIDLQKDVLTAKGYFHMEQKIKFIMNVNAFEILFTVVFSVKAM